MAHPEENRFFRPDTPGYLAPSVSLLEDGEYRGPEGTLTAHRTPLFPLFLTCLRPFGDESCLFPLALIVVGSLTVFPIYGACRRFAPPGASALAAALFALNPTAISASPLLLSDTLFLFFAALTLYFFVMFAQERRHDPFFFYCTVFCGAAGALIRPVNLLWFIPCAAALLLIRGIRFRRKILYALVSIPLFWLVLLPWIARNHAVGAGLRLDSSSAVTLVHNASSLESSVTGEPAETIRERYFEELDRVYKSDPERFASEDERLTYCEKRMVRIILDHPFRYILLSLRPAVLSPDIPTLLENLGITQSGRGTLDVLNRQGFLPAVRHYFDGNDAALAASIPLILASLVLYLGALAGLFVRLFRKDWVTVFLFFGFGMYYIWIAGPVAMPRYQLPALPVFCVLAAAAFGAVSVKKTEAKREKTAG